MGYVFKWTDIHSGVIQTFTGEEAEQILLKATQKMKRDGDAGKALLEIVAVITGTANALQDVAGHRMVDNRIGGRLEGYVKILDDITDDIQSMLL
ncbi:MAG: hypothetical protein IKH26_12675 [Bacteroidaceae bacterium]|nr:hypothetical protein [Bacteroidaceae bacterium]